MNCGEVGVRFIWKIVVDDSKRSIRYWIRILYENSIQDHGIWELEKIEMELNVQDFIQIKNV